MFLLLEVITSGYTITPQGLTPTLDFFPLAAWPSLHDCQMALGIMERLAEETSKRWVCAPLGTYGA